MWPATTFGTCCTQQIPCTLCSGTDHCSAPFHAAHFIQKKGKKSPFFSLTPSRMPPPNKIQGVGRDEDCDAESPQPFPRRRPPLYPGATPPSSPLALATLPFHRFAFAAISIRSGSAQLSFVAAMDASRTTSTLDGLLALCYCCFFAQLSSTAAR